MIIRGGTKVVSVLYVVGDRGAVEVLRWLDPLGDIGKVDPVRALQCGGGIVVVNVRMCRLRCGSHLRPIARITEKSIEVVRKCLLIRRERLSGWAQHRCLKCFEKQDRLISDECYRETLEGDSE